MTTKEILTLANAGFTAQQIAAMNSINQGNPKTEMAQMYGGQVAGMPNLDAMSQQIASLTQAVQAGNMMNQTQPAAETTDDILAQIINSPAGGAKA